MTCRVFVLLLIMVTGCGQTVPTSPSLPAEPLALHAAGVHNLFRVSDRLYSGSTPEGDAGFSSLKELGVRTVISVDGAKPDFQTAGRYGLRYVHLPIGYDGISNARAVQLAKAVRDLPGPVFIHCHHGKHRGPAACAVVQMTLETGWAGERAERWLKVAGTDSKYTGLVGLSHSFRPPSAEELDQVATDFPTTAPVPDIVRLMVEIDDHWERLKAVRKAGWKTPADHPDLDPPHVALMLAEAHREAARLGEATTRGKEFMALLVEAETSAEELAKALRTRETNKAGVAFERLQATCTKCHAAYRDRK
ncbi:MAG: cytochrome c [Fimbriiglobus sp.]|jgi:protein tyrosine phosphatase (PTP) superfamily phosphohydrolase (DUF442 family)|nr:cytochrome c [Fimbriiglobus sp.]